MIEWPAVVELRQYRLRPGRREELVALFDRELVAPQEALGLRVLGQFRDRDRADRFVWLRGFADLAAAAAGLPAFYGGPVWAEHGPAANATMVSSDDVLLLRPVLAAAPDPGGALTVTVYEVGDEAGEDAVLDVLHARPDPAGHRTIGELRTLAAPNPFPRLPIREGEHVVVRVTRHPDGDRPAPDEAALTRHLTAPPVHLRLDPTPASTLR